MTILNVLTALAVIVPVSLIFGVLLAFFISRFGIEEDETKKTIRAALPGINCGACGFKGCNDYAEALAKGEAKPNLCIPGAEMAASEICKILGVEAEEAVDLVAFVHCNGNCDAALNKAVCESIESCSASNALYGGPKLCNYGCIGCGDCESVCISEAIKVKNGVAVVDPGICVGCGLCAKQCPKHIISMVPQESAVAVYCSSKDEGADARKACKNACIGCKKCEKACPHQAITVVDNCAVVDYSKCVGCGACADGCPTGCLKRVIFADLPECFVLKVD